jgi:drug/metabolite transporter (DMT)-like permease
MQFMMSLWLSLLFVALGAVIQGLVIILSRKYGVAFLALMPLIVAHQYFFLTAYTKAGNFTIIWFFSVALTSVTALAVGVLIFHDILTWKSILGILLILCGVVLTKI